MKRFLPTMLIIGALFAEDPKIPSEPSISYTLPGIISSSGEGSDHLLNLTPDIFVIVEIVKPESMQVDLSTNTIREAVLKRFAKEGFDINFVPENTKQLPFLDVLLMMQKIEGGYAICCHVSLFEEVTLKRVILPEEITFQAVTWEKENLIVTPTEQLKEQVMQAVMDITTEFIERYKYFERQKSKLQKKVS